MKRLITAASFAVIAIPAFAAEYGKPFEQLDLERALPQINVPAVEPRSIDSRSLPYEQAQIDRAVPGLPGVRAESVRFAAAGGATVSDVSIAVDAARSSGAGESPWANDHNFIAPAQ